VTDVLVNPLRHQYIPVLIKKIDRKGAASDIRHGTVSDGVDTPIILLKPKKREFAAMMILILR
jgi:hypothetical protein